MIGVSRIFEYIQYFIDWWSGVGAHIALQAFDRVNELTAGLQSSRLRHGILLPHHSTALGNVQLHHWSRRCDHSIQVREASYLLWSHIPWNMVFLQMIQMSMIQHIYWKQCSNDKQVVQTDHICCCLISPKPFHWRNPTDTGASVDMLRWAHKLLLKVR
jgi:hypothetical protein